MPWYATVALGVGGSLVGGIVVQLLIGTAGGFFFAFLGAVLLLYLYRRFVQHRGLTDAPRKRDRGSAARARTPLGRQRPAAVAPRVRVDAQMRLVELVDVEAARLAAPVRARLPEPRRDRDGDAALAAGRRSRTRAARRRCSGGCARRRSARRPRRRATRGRGCAARPASCASATARRSGGGAAPRREAATSVATRASTCAARCELRVAHAAATGCRHGRTELSPTATMRSLRYDRLGRLPLPLELLVRAREARRERVRDVVVARDASSGGPSARRSVRRGLVLLGRAAMGEVAARDHELRLEPLDERRERPLRVGGLRAPTCRSDTCRMRVSTGEAGYTLET